MKIMSKFFFTILALSLLGSTHIFAEEIKDAEKPQIQEDTKTPEKPKRQVDTLFGSNAGKNIYISGYGAATASYSRIKGENALLCGGRGGVILDNFVIGFSGTGLAYPHRRDDFGDNAYTDDRPYVNFGYGGAMIEYYFNPKSLVNFAIGTTIGGGGLSFSSHSDDDDDHDNRTGTDKFFVVEPEANMFINLARFCRLGAGVSYRYIAGLDRDNYKDSNFRGLNAKVIVSFGWF